MPPAWLEENKAEMKTLINQFIEAQLDDEPPSVEEVTLWARRVLPLVNEFRDRVFQMTDSMREYMTDDQIDMLEAELAAFDTGITLINRKLYVWAEGGYDPETEWVPPGPERRRREREEERARREAMEQARRETLRQAHPGGRPLASTRPTTGQRKPADEWEVFTLQFIERYRLNSEQRQKAMQFLRAAQEERDRYLRRRADAWKKVEQRLRDAKTEPERQTALAQFETLNAPVQRMFQKLKDRLNTLPTREQRRSAALREQQKREQPSTARRPSSTTPRTSESSKKPD